MAVSDLQGHGAMNPCLGGCACHGPADSPVIREMDIREVELEVDIVKRGAIQLYEALGFKIARGIPMIDNNTMDDENGSYYLMKLVVNES